MVIPVRIGPQARTKNVFMKWVSVFSDL
jgi:hypothetical protein